MAYRRLDYTLAARSLPEDHPHAIHIKLPTPIRSTLTRKPSFIAKLKAKISRKDLQNELYDDDAVSLDSSVYSQEVEANMDGARGRRSALALCDGDDQLMADAMKKHEEQKALFRAPSKHSEAISRGPSTHPSTLLEREDVFGIAKPASKARICTDMASWAQFPSHTRADRCGSAGRVDAMSIVDFGDPARLRLGAVRPADEEGIPPSSSMRRRTTNGSRKSRKRRGLVKSTSQGLERVGRYYSNLFATANFRGNNRRTSVSASTGVLQHPELEMLAPAPVLDSRQPVHEHLKRVDADLGMLSSAFRIPSFSRLGHHSKATAEQEDEPDVGPDDEEASTSCPAISAPEPVQRIEWNNMPFRKLSTFFLVEGKSRRSKEVSDVHEVDGVPLPSEEEGPPFGPVQIDGAAIDTHTIDTLDSIEGAEMKSG